MAEGIALSLVVEAVKGLVSRLREVSATVKHNEGAVRNIDQLVDDLNRNLVRFKSLLPVTINRDAIGESSEAVIRSEVIEFFSGMDIQSIGVESAVLEWLVNILMMETNSIIIQEGLIHVLFKLLESEENLLTFAKSKTCVEALISALANRESPKLLYWAARTIADLTGMHEGNFEHSEPDKVTPVTHEGEVITWEGRFKRVQDLLSEEVDRGTQREALRAILHFARWKNSEDVPYDKYPILTNFVTKNIVDGGASGYDKDFLALSIAVLSHVGLFRLDRLMAVPVALKLVSLDHEVAEIDLSKYNTPLVADKSYPTVRDSALLIINNHFVRTPERGKDEKLLSWESFYFKSMEEWIDSFNQFLCADGTPQKVLRAIISSADALPNLMDLLIQESDDYTLYEMERLLYIATGSKEGVARILKKDPHELQLLVRFFLDRSRSYFRAFISVAFLKFRANAYYHSQASYFQETLEERRGLNSTYASTLDWEVCNLIYSVGKGEENRKVIADVDHAYLWLDYVIENGEDDTLLRWAREVRRNVFPYT